MAHFLSPTYTLQNIAIVYFSLQLNRETSHALFFCRRLKESDKLFI